MGIMKEMEKHMGERAITESFLKNREVFLWGQVDEKSSEEIVKKILFLNSESNEKIKLYINSPGGIISSGFAIYDVIQSIKSPVSTICTGQAASMGAIILCCGEKGERIAWPHAKIMIHQPLISGNMFGPASDIKIQADEMIRVREDLNQILSKHTGKKIDEIIEDTDRDFYMDAKESLKYGIIDKIAK